jgi:hypothetical protein
MDGDKVIDNLGLDLDEGTVSAEAGVVDEEGKSLVAREPSLDLRQGFRVGEVGHERFGLGASLAAQSRGERLQPIASPRHQDHIMSVSCETLGKGLPYARGRSRDQRDGS